MAYFRRLMRRRCQFLILFFCFSVIHLAVYLLFDVSVLSFYGFTKQTNSNTNEDFNKYFFSPQLKQAFLKRKESIYDLRRKAVKLACDKMSIENPELYRSIQMPEDPLTTAKLGGSAEYELLWAKVAKAGTSSWRLTFEILRNVTTTPNIEERSRYQEARTRRQTLLEYWNNRRRKGSVAFTFTRHPFERIVATYRGKLENRTRTKPSAIYHESIGTYIVRHYRSNSSKEVIEQEECTFEEFVRFLLREGGSLDRHWTPMVNLTYPCNLEYDVYGRMETFNDDSWYIILKKNLEHLTTVRWDNKGGFGKSTSSYIRKLPNHLIEALYEKYRADFEVFGYDIKEYMSDVKS